jgi:hypothetical protein
LKATKADWIRDGKLRFLLQYGARPLPEIKGAPFALDLISDPLKREIMQIASAPLAVGRPIAAPPGVLGERVGVLRSALTDTFKDARYLSDCSRTHLECEESVSGEEVSRFIDQAYKASPEAVKTIREIYQAGAAR